MMQVIRVCDDGAGGKADIALCVCVCVCMCEYAIVPECTQHVIAFFVFAYLCVCVCVFMVTLFPCGWCGGWYGDRRCMVPRSLRPPNYLSSSPRCKGQCTIIGSPSYCAAH